MQENGHDDHIFNHIRYGDFELGCGFLNRFLLNIQNLEIDRVSGAIQFDWKPLRQIVASNHELVFSNDAQVIDLIAAWYSCLRLSGYRNDAAELFYKQCEALKTFGTSRVFPGPTTPQ